MTAPSPDQFFNFANQVVVVTGAGGGIGAGIARRFGEAGAAVVVNYLHNREGADQVVREIESLGSRAVHARADVTQRDQIEALANAALTAFGRIDVWVNNAGTYPLASVLEMSDGDWKGVVESNLTSVFIGTQVAARQMRAQGGGAIINIASIEAEFPAARHSHYDAAKGGVLMHTRAAAYELGAFGIRVNAVSPGLIWREGIEQDWAEGVARWQNACPLKRLGLPEDVADACLFFASPAARWITGANLVVDGGVTTHPIY